MTEHSNSGTVLTEETPCLKKLSVNKRLLPVKLHYFLFYGGVGCVMPYMPLVGKELGINATAVGLVYTIVPFMVLFSKPGFGALTDHFRNLRLIMYILVLITTMSFFLVIFIPPISSSSHSDGNVTVHCLTHSVVFQTPSYFDTSCVRKMIVNGTTCQLKLLENHEPNVSKSSEFSDVLDIRFSQKESLQDGEDELVNIKIVNHTAYFNVTDLGSISEKFTSIVRRADIKFPRNSTMLCNSTGSVYVAKCTPSLQPCSSRKESDPDLDKVYGTYQFWLFTILAVISGTGSATLFCLSDAACMEVLGEETELYGRQRLWATISWGLCTLLTGYLNDLASTAYSYTTYTPGFYLMLGFVFLDLFALYGIAPHKSNFSSNICKDVGRIFKSCEIVCFAVAVTVIGSLTGLLWSYQFWYLQDLGANQLLLGLTVAVQCLVAEVPFFFLSGYIIRTFGHLYCIVGAFAAFCLRYLLYFFLKDPWYVLPIEILHGQTYGTFYATMTSYAKTKAPAGTEATMIGVMGGLFEGLGLAIGNILSGIGFDYLSGRYTFLIASALSGVCTVAFFIVKLILRRTSTK